MEILRAGATQRRKLDGLESRLLAIADEIAKTESVLFPAEMAREGLRRALETMMHDHPSSLAEGFQSPIEAPSLRVKGGLQWWDLANEFGIDFVLDRFMKRAVTGDRVGLPPAQRAKRIEELRAETLAIERAIEIEALALEAAGHTVLRRADADLSVLFEVWAGLEAAPV